MIINPEFFTNEILQNKITDAAALHGLPTLLAPTLDNRSDFLKAVANDLKLSKTDRMKNQLGRSVMISTSSPKLVKTNN